MKNRVLLTLTICLTVFLGVLLINQAVAQDSGSSGTPSNQDWEIGKLLGGFPEPLKQDGVCLPLNSVGTELALPDTHPYFPSLKVCSSEVVRLILEAGNKMVSLHIEPVSITAKPETTITITGLKPFGDNEIYHHQDGFVIKNFTLIDGECSFIQDLSKTHHIYFLLHASTINVYGQGVERDQFETIGVWVEPTVGVLTGTVTQGIIIQVDGITLDGKDPETGDNHTIKGTGSGFGIYLWKRSGVIIKNCIVQNFSHGIDLGLSSNNTFTNNTVHSNASGIYLGLSSGNTFFSNIVNSNYGIGIMHDRSSNNILSTNTVYLNKQGIYLNGSSSNTVTNNTVYSNYKVGIHFTASSGNTLSSNIVNSNYDIAIWLGASSNNILSGNAANFNTSGFYINYYSNFNTLTGNTANSNNVGIILMTGSYKNVFIENTITNNFYYGILLTFQPRYNIIYHNNIYNNALNIESSIVLELSYEGEGNWWGHTEEPGFYVWGGAYTPYDSNRPDVVDSHPYLVKDGWLRGYDPKQEGNQPPECDVTFPEQGEELTGDITITFTVMDPEGDVVTVTVFIDDIQVGITTVDTSITDTGYITFDSTPYPNGYRVRIECDDDYYLPGYSSKDQGDEPFTIVVVVVNQLPQLTLNQPGMDPANPEIWGSLPPYDLTTPTDISYTIVEPNLDTLAVTFYQRIDDGPWFTIGSDVITPTVITGTYPFPWDTWALTLDDNRYQVRVDVIEIETDEHYTDTAQSITSFTINNSPLLIDPLVPAPQVINPTFGETTLLPFELSEPATVTVDILDPADPTISLRTIDAGLMMGGIRSVPWDGKDDAGNIVGVAPAPGYSFKVTGIDSLENPPTIAISDTTLVPPESVLVRAKRPVIAKLSESPDPFSPFLPIQEFTTLFYTLYTVEAIRPHFNDLGVKITLVDEIGGPVATLFEYHPTTIEEIREGSPYPDGIEHSDVTWDGAEAVAAVENGVFKYTIEAGGLKADGTYLRPEPPDNWASPKDGVILAIDYPDVKTRVTHSADTNLTVYTQPIGVGVTIETVAYVPAEVTSATLGLQKFDNYQISPFYNIIADAPEQITPPVIILFKYDPSLSPEAITLWQYDPVAKDFMTVPAVVDTANNQIIGEAPSLSLFGLFVNKDTTSPWIEDFALTPEILNFTVKDNLRGINISAIKVVLDDEDITEKLTIIGKDGDLSVKVSGEDIFLPNLATHTLTIIARDMAANVVRETFSFIAGYTRVLLVLKPEALKVNPGVLTAYVKFPAPFGVPKTLEATLDGGALERWMVSEKGLPEEGLEGPIVVIKFRREAVEQALTEKGEVLDTDFLLKGKFDDGTALFEQFYTFEGKDSITKIVE